MIKELIKRAKQGDKQALQALRNSGYFEKKKAQQAGYPTSHAQRRLWVLSQMEVEAMAATYNIPHTLILEGDLKRSALQTAFDQLVTRHEGLRTRFAMVKEELRQFVDDSAEIPLQYSDLQQRPDPLAAAQTIVREDAGQPFDLQKSPLMRGKVLQVSAEKHVLYMNIHHIVADGWSIDLLMAEFVALYNALSQETTPELSPLTHHYRQYAAWQNKRLAGDQGERLEKFWRDNLAGELPLLNLPTDNPRPPILTSVGGVASVMISAETTHALRQFARQHRTTLFTLLTAATTTLLHRYTGQEDIVIGTPSAGREDARWQNVVGFLINSLPLRTQITGNDSFNHVIEQARETVLQAYEHQDYPFDKLVNDLGIAYDASRNPIFDVAVNLQHMAEQPVMLEGLQISALENDTVTAKFDLTFEFVESAETLHLHLVYNTSLYNHATIERMVAHFATLLDALLHKPERPIATLNMLPATESAQLAAWNKTSAAYSKTDTILSLFTQQARQTPDNYAVIFGETRLTYRELDRYSNTIAAKLLQREVNVGDTVAILLGRSHEMIVAILGVLKAGGVYVPVDPTYPRDRIVYMLADCGTNCVITRPEYQSYLDDSLSMLDMPGCDVQTDALIWPVVAPHAPAYIIYTSGSTGVPKGCIVRHESVVSLLTNANIPYQFNAQDVWIVVHSFCFDFSVWEMYGALFYGGRVVVAESDTLRDPVALLALIKQEKVTVLNQTPAAFYSLIHAGLADPNPNLHEHLRYVLFGGDYFELTYLREWVLQYPLDQIRLFNVYGTTETTVIDTFCPITEASVWSTTGRNIIGRPLPETRIHILNSAQLPQPIGIVGELYIGGSGVSNGYLGKPDLTGSRFIQGKNDYDHPHGFHLYKTGDLGRWLPDGTLEYRGRNDFQVQLRGFRIELGEIEAVIVAHDSIEKCIVLARGTGTSMQLVAYLILHPNQMFVQADIVAQIKAHLPTYMLPSAFVVLDKIPFTRNGKIDRKALPEPDYVADHQEHYIAPRTELEAQVAGIWQAVLEVARVGIEDDFFTLGGHSLNAMLVVARIQSELGIVLRLRDLFEYPTIAGLQPHLVQNEGEIEAIRQVDSAESYPLSHAQRRLWIINNMGVNNAAYNVPIALWLNGDLDISAFSVALRDVINRHESLRTSIDRVDDQPRQFIHAPLTDSPLKIVDLRGQPNADTQLAQQVQIESDQPFDLALFPLFRVTLFQLAEQRQLFLFNAHHIICDGWSLDLLLTEVLSAYAHPETPLAALPIHYKEYAVWQSDYLANETGTVQRNYWHMQLAGELPVLDLPTDRPRPMVQTFVGRAEQINFSKEESQALIRLGREHAATPFMLSLALVNLLLYRYTGQEDMILGSPIAGRDHPDLVEQVGFYVNMLPLRSHVKGTASFIDLLNQVSTTVKGAFDHQQYPFDLLVSELALERDLSRSPLFDVAVSLQTIEPPQTDLALQIEAYASESKISKWDMAFFFHHGADDQLYLGIEYNSDLFDAARIKRMGQHVRQLLRDVVKMPFRPISQLSLLNETEKQTLSHFNNTERPYPAQQTIAALFETQAAQTPDNIAVLVADKQLTYQQLNQKANRLAHTLRTQFAVEAETPVALLFNRSEWSIVALLAILKAGGCYLPLDPAYPSQRIRYMLEDANCRVVLSEPEHLDGLLAGVAGGVDIEAILSDNSANLPPLGDSHNLAYIMYTSGSTGQPKGVLVEQQAVVRLVRNTNFVTLTPESRLLQAGSLAFDASTFEVWGALLNGGAVCLPDKNTLLNGAELGKLIRQHAVSDMFITASLFNQFVESDPALFKGMKTVICGGEKLSPWHCNQFLDALPETKLVNGYGPTENTTFSTYYPVQKTEDADIPIGYPLANSTVHIIDSADQHVPIGVVGEICVGGDGVARGYLNRPNLTKERFVNLPQFGRIYKTGDLGMWLPDGAVKFVGRIDNQLKVRGFRIEPGEIEQALLQYQTVQEAAVMPRTTSVGTKELVAYLVAEEPVSVATLRAYLGENLPSYMIPAHFVQLAAFPLNRNGKTDRGVLHKCEPLITSDENKAIARPRNAAEQVLCEVWQDVLNRPKLSIHDNYFEIGGDSIRAIQITSRLLRQGWKLAIQDLFANPTIAELAHCLESAEAHADQSQIVGNVPLIPVQQWFFDVHQTDRHHFNQAVLLTSTQRLEVDALEQTINAILQQHDMLRATYQAGVQTIQAIISADFELIETDDIAPAIEAAHQQFDLTQGPLLSARLLRQTTGDSVLLVAHHLVVDGVSWRILLEDLEIGYTQAAAGNPIDLGAKTASYQQWAEAIQERTNAGAWREGCDVWLEMKGSASTPTHVYGDTETVGFALSETETAALLYESNHAYHTEINDLLLTALARVLESWTEPPLITLEGHGREPIIDLDVSRTVGWFTTLYPFLLQLSTQEIGAQIKEIKEALRHIPHKGFDYGILCYCTDELERKIEPRMSFNYLGQFDSDEHGLLRFSTESSGTPISPRTERTHELDIIGLIGSNQLAMSITFNPQLHDESAMQQFLSDFEAELRAIITHCQQQTESEKTVSDFTMRVSTDELSSILDNLF